MVSGKKYKLVPVKDEEFTYYIEAVVTFVNKATNTLIEKGTVGGKVKYNIFDRLTDWRLSQEGSCWICENVTIDSTSFVKDDVFIKGNVSVEEESKITGKAIIACKECVISASEISGLVIINGNYCEIVDSDIDDYVHIFNSTVEFGSLYGYAGLKDQELKDLFLVAFKYNGKDVIVSSFSFYCSILYGDMKLVVPLEILEDLAGEIAIFSLINRIIYGSNFTECEYLLSELGDDVIC